MRRSRRNFIKVSAVVGAGALVPRDWWMMRAMAQAAAQVPLASKSIPQFVDPLPGLELVPGDTGFQIPLWMREFKARVMPTGFVPANGLPYAGTDVWGYSVSGDCGNGGFDRTNRSQGNKGDPMGQVSPGPLGSLQRQARLAGAARTYQADAAALGVGDEPVQVDQLLLAP